MDNSKIGCHISGLFNKELENIHNQVITMGGLVERQIEFAMYGFITDDIELAIHVIEQVNQVDFFETSLEQECIKTIALRQPKAFDLRFLISVIKIVNVLAKIGNQAERICKMTIQSPKLGAQITPNPELQHMDEQVKIMLHNTLDSFVRMDIDDIMTYTQLENTLNHDYDCVYRHLISQMLEDPRNIARIMNALWIAKTLERMGDYVCHIDEHLIYMMTGRSVRHLS